VAATVSELTGFRTRQLPPNHSGISKWGIAPRCREAPRCG
jgi:hypothetical protein